MTAETIVSQKKHPNHLSDSLSAHKSGHDQNNIRTPSVINVGHGSFIRPIFNQNENGGSTHLSSEESKKLPSLGPMNSKFTTSIRQKKPAQDSKSQSKQNHIKLIDLEFMSSPQNQAIHTNLNFLQNKNKNERLSR